MASLITDPNGRRRVQFVAGDGRKMTVRLGDVSLRNAERAKTFIQRMLGAIITADSFDDETHRWLAEIDETLHGRLAKVGLVKARTASKAILGTFIDTYIEGRSDFKPNTLINMKQCRRWLVKHFGESRDMRTVTHGEAEEFRLHMIRDGLREGSIRRHIGRARQLFKAAAKRGLIRGTNPFEGMAATVRSDKSRRFFVTREMTTAVLNACPNLQWKLLVALSRYGGLRCPSETLALKWSDVDLDHNVIRVPSPKTEHLEGGECRMIPLYPELRPLLEQALGEQLLTDESSRSDYVITRYRDARVNLRTHFERIIIKAGLKSWPKPWHNMRATRQTELAARHPIHVVCDWMGNSTAVAQEHYLTVRDEDFALALIPVETPAPKATPTTPFPTLPALPTLVQTVPETAEPTEKPAYSDAVADSNYPRQGQNDPRVSSGNRAVSQQVDAFSDAVATEGRSTQPDKSLKQIIDAWPSLSDDVRARILRLIESIDNREQS